MGAQEVGVFSDQIFSTVHSPFKMIMKGEEILGDFILISVKSMLRLIVTLEQSTHPGNRENIIRASKLISGFQKRKEK